MKAGSLLIALALGFAPIEDHQAARHSGTVQGIDVRVEGYRTEAELKLFPSDKNSPTVKAQDGMTLGIVTLSVTPSDGATLLNGSDFKLRGGTGATYDLVFTKLFNMCEGRRKQTCQLPFNVPMNVKVASLMVGTLELSLEGLVK